MRPAATSEQLVSDMAAHDLYTAGASMRARKSADETVDISYYVDGISNALDWLKALEPVGDRDDFQREKQDREQLALQWLDAIRDAGLAKPALAEVVDGIRSRGHGVRRESTASGMLDAIRLYVVETSYELGTAFSAGRATPW